MASRAVLAEKQELIDQIKHTADNSVSLVLAHYRGLTVTEMSAIRSKSRELSVTVKVAKNKLVRRALSETQFSGLDDFLTGPVVMCFSHKEPSASAKLVKEMAQTSPLLKVVAIGLENKVLASDAVDTVAKMPNKQQAIAMLLGGLQGPVTGLACALKETYAKLVRTLFEVAKVKQA